MINLIKREKPEVFKNSFDRDDFKKISNFNESKLNITLMLEMMKLNWIIIQLM
ncbi:hypothetical protein [Spiroplasma turonicum]|uniref:Uncharacterized protein n=1 Tax=Spiroplasma turonicum TaxID=216946 RepID=A0A0K1P7F5_9MOLU|nr:hypothetical protein [Spiroplasma turonicum]AKU79837.1 hypothetical protein STURON_00591 [Spiroplasma turonicum]ALX70853.1 hypothetical protein STURO_v1c05870 [Spiroplasma turonicum]